MTSFDISFIPFRFEQSDVRVMIVDGIPWFVARDVAAALGYARPNDAVGIHCKHAKSLIDIDTVKRRIQQNQPLSLDHKTKLIPEPDVYRLILRSKLPSAARFEAWVMEEVLPTIRRTGGYSGIPDTPADRRHAPDIETHLTHAVDHLSGALHNLTEALQQAQGLCG
ncbi:Bro-N domain-containing protein [Thiorhodospira sibirica]|uniref:BRO-N domain-containing protein n=1 Tax=Thiorhodospira sibirica TaxID=154347 RepID=UPI001C8D0192|nr:BRO family protein [Thiorhodospira sibirica]